MQGRTNSSRFLVRGGVVNILRDLHRAQFLEAEWAAFLESLPESAPWRRPMAEDDWIDPAEVVPCEDKAVAWLGHTTVRIRGEVVAERVVAAEIPGLNLREGVEGFLRTVSVYWSWIHQGSILSLEHLDTGHARLRMEGPIPYPEWATTVAPTLLRRPMELLGAQRVEIKVHPMPMQGLRFDLLWIGGPA